jgi:NAD(P)-dependent dehydrogenase (short-subunit alcohol dehydrogenase family)
MQRKIVITGVTQGLGRALTEAFISLGHIVMGCGRNAGEIKNLELIHGKLHGFSVVDVASDDDVAAWASEVLRRIGPPDLLLNNAAVINPNAPLWKVSATEFSRVIDINIKGVANVLRHYLPAMIPKKQGVIVNFSSGWGRSASPEVAPYCATKWAIEGLTQALAQELPPGMAAIPLNPGIIDTAMLRSCFGKSASAYSNPIEWAKSAAPYLLSLGARQNGIPLTVPGG